VRDFRRHSTTEGVLEYEEPESKVVDRVFLGLDTIILQLSAETVGAERGSLCTAG
jgi:hypothetical protein